MDCEARYTKGNIGGFAAAEGVVESNDWDLELVLPFLTIRDESSQVGHSKTNMEAADKYEHLCVAINRILERGQNQRASMSPDNTATKLGADAEFDHRQLRRSKRSFSMDRSRRSSVLSVISLDQVEDLASLPLPLYSCEIYNKSQYIFVKQHASVRTRVRPKSAGFSLGVLEPRQKSLVTKVASLWKLQTKGFDISGPFNARHNTHIGMDIMTGKMRVLGQEVGSYR